MNGGNDIPEDQVEVSQSMEEFMAEQIGDLYRMKCFDTMMNFDGVPMVTRVPGGWLWLIQSGGSMLKTSSEQQVIGASVLMPVFVPLNNEFMGKRQPFPH